MTIVKAQYIVTCTYRSTTYRVAILLAGLALLDTLDYTYTDVTTK
jgi:hypothetical protein